MSRTSAELRAEVAAQRAADRSIGFVPTMGALHEGHLSLIRAARQASDAVVLSIFVNPLQFGPGEDLERYPRDEGRDLELAEQEGADIAFLPSVDEMYPPRRSTTVSVGELTTIVEGAVRPGHFDGVATVVAKLFNLVTPDVAYFGQKDAQQVAVIKKMVADLSLDVRIEVCPTVRESDGLALSSRNRYLSSDERERALSLWRALEIGRDAWEADRTVEVCEKEMWDALLAAGTEPDYARVVDPETFGPPLPGGDVLLVIAARVGSTRLIDNLLVVR